MEVTTAVNEENKVDNSKTTMKINSHNEWDTLKEVIVGSAARSEAVLTWNKPGPIPEKILEKGQRLSKEAYPQWFLDEVAEDLDNLSDVFRKFGAKVFRPNVFDINAMYSTPEWSSTSNNIYNVRDLHLVVGDNVIETPSPDKARYYEATALYDIWYEYYKQGFNWYIPPRPKLVGDVLTPYYRDESERELTQEDLRYQELTDGRLEKLHKLTEKEILFEAANTLRMGKDLLFLVSSSGNYAAVEWLRSVLGDEYRVHTTADIYRSSHIDSTALALRPGLVLLNSTRVNEKNCPQLFDEWEKIYFEDVAPVTEHEIKFQREVRDVVRGKIMDLGFLTNLELMASPWVGMNVISLDENTLVCDERQTNLIKVLEKHKFNIVTVCMRHIYTQGGGLHCATLDTVRNSKLESYFDNV